MHVTFSGQLTIITADSRILFAKTPKLRNRWKIWIEIRKVHVAVLFGGFSRILANLSQNRLEKTEVSLFVYLCYNPCLVNIYNSIDQHENPSSKALLIVSLSMKFQRAFILAS